MSKAFTRESDDIPERPIVPRPLSALPPGVKNYLTADGAQRLREELERLEKTERPRILSLADPSERELQMLDQRIAYLRQSLHTAVIVQPASEPPDQVRFGATVTVRNKAGEKSQYRIVGVDEIDVDRGWVSWRSPISRALMNTRVGQRVTLKLPAGDEELEILTII